MYKNKKPNYNERVFSDSEIQDIIDSYLSGESSVKIGKRYNITHKPILKVLHNNNIDVNQAKVVRKYQLNEHYFDVIDNSNKAYILGFLYADGHNEISKSTVTISLQEEDKEILEKMNKELQSNRPLEFIDNSNKHDYGYNYKNQYRLSVFSKYMCLSLEKIGMISSKSLSLTFPELPEQLLSHFIRGYFDGDGSFCPFISKQGKFRPLITITSTKQFCESTQCVIQQQCHISCGNIYDASCHNGITKVLSFSGANQVKIFLDWLYQDAELYLQRKYNRYLNSFNINNSLTA